MSDELPDELRGWAVELEMHGNYGGDLRKAADRLEAAEAVCEYLANRSRSAMYETEVQLEVEKRVLAWSDLRDKDGDDDE